MSWSEARSVAVAIAALDAAAAVLALLACAVLGALDLGSFGTALFVIGVGYSLFAAVAGGGAMPSHLPRSPDTFNSYARTRENEMLAQQTTSGMVAHSIEQLRRMSWLLVFGLASVPLFVVGGALALRYAG